MTRREMIRALLMGAGGLVLSDRLAPAASANGTLSSEGGLNVLLGRPTAESVTLSIMASRDCDGRVTWGTHDGSSLGNTPVRLRAGEPTEVIIDALKPDRGHAYAVQVDGASALGGRFHTQRAPGSEFTFTIIADSHLDESTDPRLYEHTLANVLADAPDFHIDLGDTFMTDKHPTREAAAAQYLAQRDFFGLIGHSVPLFLMLGNHDGEAGRYVDGTAGSLAVWSHAQRTSLFPNPLPDGFFSGNEQSDPHAGLLQDYYAWEWGDALFVVLDPYWYTPRQRRGDDNWTCTLGEAQYRWLQAMLAGSDAALKFVFIHQLVGGSGRDGRGGVEVASLYEWGGHDPDGSDVFAQKRPGWPMPIHDLLVAHGVSAVFHGHDHLFAAQELEGIVYLEVPQPAWSGRENLRLAAEYGYVEGTLLGSSGHLRVSVRDGAATVDYVRSRLATDRRQSYANREVAHSYDLPAARQ